jgi:multidrug efflux pump
LGTAVFAGMTTATLLSVFFIPVLYYAIEMLLDKLRGSRATPAKVKSEPLGQSGSEEGERS